jgi:hypothetical protein
MTHRDDQGATCGLSEFIRSQDVVYLPVAQARDAPPYKRLAVRITDYVDGTAGDVLLQKSGKDPRCIIVWQVARVFEAI